MHENVCRRGYGIKKLRRELTPGAHELKIVIIRVAMPDGPRNPETTNSRGDLTVTTAQIA